jgi:hypothetical protein
MTLKKTEPYYLLLFCLLFLSWSVHPALHQVIAQGQAQDPLIFFYPSYLSPDSRLLAIEIWSRQGKDSPFKKDIGFLNFRNGHLLPRTISRSLLDFNSDSSYIEGEGLCWDPEYSERVYFTLQRYDPQESSFKLANVLFRYNVSTSTLETMLLGLEVDGIVFPIAAKDGKHVFFIGYRGKRNNADSTSVLGVYNLQLGKVDILAKEIDTFRPLLSPDNTRILFRRNGDLFVMPAYGGPHVRLTSFNGDSRIISTYWEGEKIYFIRLTPPYEQLSRELKDFFRGKKNIEEPSYTRELWEISLKEGRPYLRRIEVFKTMKLGTDLYRNTFVVPLQEDHHNSSIWKYEIQQGSLGRLTSGKYTDDLPMIVHKERSILFRRNGMALYRTDIEGEDEPQLLFGGRSSGP